MRGSYDIPVSTDVQRRYDCWKDKIPVIYDWFLNHNLYWPSLTCRWGPQIEETRHSRKQRLYLAEQTDGETAPNTLLIADCEILKRGAANEDIKEFCEDDRSPNIKKHKAIIHPGEVNKIKEMPQNNNLLITHTDAPELFLWDINAQPARHAIRGAANSIPNLMLAGHRDVAQFALDVCASEPLVISGGKDQNIVLWNVHDQVTSLAMPPPYFRPRLGRQHLTVVTPRATFRAHTNTVEDVAFNPDSSQEFCSVGDDSRLMIWDPRRGPDPVVKIDKAHNEEDIHCVEWNKQNTNFLITGSADKSVHMYDRRYLHEKTGRDPVYTFHGHDAPILCIQWCPDRSSVFGSCGEDGIVNIWDYEKVGCDSPSSSSGDLKGEKTPPEGLLFRHVGHRHRAVEFQWNPAEPWTIVSLSDDCRGPGGGTLQMWRMMDVIYEEFGRSGWWKLAALNRFRPCTEGHCLASIRDLSFGF